MSTATIRPYRGGDEQGIVACWNAACPKEPIHLNTFVRRVLCDANFNPSGVLVAEAEQRIVGFIIAVVRRVPMAGTDLEPQNGWITAFAVHPDFQRQRIGSRLLEQAWDFFRQEGRRTVSFADYAPHYFVPGLDQTTYTAAAKFLTYHGFAAAYEAVAMDRNIVLFNMPPDVLETEKQRQREGYVFSPLTTDRLAETIAFASEMFHADWGRAIREAISTGIRYDHILIAINPADRVVGFTLFGGYDGIPERFGPFGVADSERGKGLGKVLLYRTLETMWRHGLHNCWFLWTGEKTPAGHLYFRAGFEVTRTFHIMRRALN